MLRCLSAVILAGLSASASAEPARVTDERVSRLLAGWKAEISAMAAARREHEAAKKAYQVEMEGWPAIHDVYEERQQSWAACQKANLEPASARGQRQMDAAVGDPEAAKARMQALAPKIKAAGERGDMAELHRLMAQVNAQTAPVNAAAQKMSSEMQAAAEKCGPEPTKPRQPVPPPYPPDRQRAAGARAANLTEGFYAALEDRVLWALDSRGRVDLEPKPADAPGPRAPYTAAEAGALRRRGPEVADAWRDLLGARR